MDLRATERNMKGFSLTELMVVLSTFGVLLAIGVPAMAGYLRSSRVAGATHMLAADIRYTRALATEQRKTYRIALDSGAYAIIRLSPLDTVRTRALPRGVACSASDTLTFFAWGLTSPAAITVAGDGSSKTVQLAANGRVSHD